MQREIETGIRAITDGSNRKKAVNKSGEIQIFENQVWLSSEEAAMYLRRSVGQLRNMVYRGQLEHRKFCRRLYFRRTDLERAIETSFKGGLSWQ